MTVPMIGGLLVSTIVAGHDHRYRTLEDLPGRGGAMIMAGWRCSAPSTSPPRWRCRGFMAVLGAGSA